MLYLLLNIYFIKFEKKQKNKINLLHTYVYLLNNIEFI